MKRGMTLIELLVAMVLTTIMAFIIFQFVQEQDSNYQVTRQKIKLQSDAREGIRIMEQEIRNAGYRVSLSVNSAGELSVVENASVKYANGAFLDPFPATATVYSNCDQKIEFKAYTPRPPDLSITDANNLWRIGYCWNKNSGTISRQAVKGGGAFSAMQWVPMLTGVQAFEIQYGTKRPIEPLLTSAEFTATPANWDLWNANVALTSGLQIRDNGAAGKHAVVFRAKKILSGIDRNEGDNTYRISFTVVCTQALLDQIAGLGDDGKVTIGLFAGGTPKESDLTFSFRPLTSARTISFDMSLSASSLTSSDPLYFGLSYNTLGGTTQDRGVTISNLSIRKMSGGSFTWSSPVSLTSTDVPTIGAVRILATVKGKKNGLMNFDRIIPVVNNETL